VLSRLSLRGHGEEPKKAQTDESLSHRVLPFSRPWM
jgi:hypothetical protein